VSSDRRSAAVALGPTNVPPTLGEYNLLTKLASGGMATVYVARKSGVAGFERLVAIKCCHPHLRDDEEFVNMFLDEARLAASIRHPNVVATLDVSDGDYLYLVMEYIEGCSLGNLVRHAAKSGVMVPPAIAVRVMIDTLLGLHAAHELKDSDGKPIGLVHRDVSPQNILIGVDGVSRITDFGIAFASARSTVTQEGRIKGKFSYLSPEQARSQPVTRRMDVFSAGTVLWESLTGRPLFRRTDDAATISAVLTGTVQPPSKINRGLPPGLDAVVMKALQRNPDSRFQTAAEFAEALERLPIEGMASRAVGAYVQKTFEAGLTERRELIRQAPEQHRDPRSSHSRPRATFDGQGTPTGQTSPTPVTADQITELPGGSITSTLVSAPSNEEIEHRRMRGILAAAMLLLVGSALGLLLARAPTDAGSSPSQPANHPATK
jgi:eukaryotic-like serine/threonine-protein kinase